jgi:hypothetical protein
MPYNLQNLNVASLDFEDIRESLIDFFEQQPDLSDIDFENPASSANLLVNILATVTAYNGVYAQFGFVNSFATTTTLLESLLGIAANNSVLIAPTQGAVSTRTITVGGTTLAPYTTFTGNAPNGANVYFFNVDQVPANKSSSITLYSGAEVVSYTNYDYKTQSCQLPYNIDPRTIKMYETPIGGTAATEWTRVSKVSTTNSTNNLAFTVINGPEGYTVTNNFATSKTIPTSSSILIQAVVSNGTLGNNAIITARNTTYFNTQETPDGGYDVISVDLARYKLLFDATAQGRCVTINDFVKAILSSGVSGTSNRDLIIVETDCCIPGVVNITVDGLSTANQTALLAYLNDRAIAGIRLVYKP